MSDCQFMTPTLSGSLYSVNRFFDTDAEYAASMRDTARSDFGARLFKARKALGLTQVAIAKKVGMSQPAYQEAETVGNGSTKTAQLAKALGVNPHWLATGKGAMHSEAANAEAPLPPSNEIDLALETLARAITPTSKMRRLSLVPMVSLLVMEPEQVHEIAAQVRALLLAPSGLGQADDNGGASRAIHDTSNIPFRPTKNEQRTPVPEARRGTSARGKR